MHKTRLKLLSILFVMSILLTGVTLPLATADNSEEMQNDTPTVFFVTRVDGNLQDYCYIGEIFIVEIWIKNVRNIVNITLPVLDDPIRATLESVVAAPGFEHIDNPQYIPGTTNIMLLAYPHEVGGGITLDFEPTLLATLTYEAVASGWILGSASTGFGFEAFNPTAPVPTGVVLIDNESWGTVDAFMPIFPIWSVHPFEIRQRQHTITFRPGDNGTDEDPTLMPPTKVPDGEDFTVPENEFNRNPGYTFDGWEDSRDGAIHQPGDVIPDIDEDFYLTAQWRRIEVRYMVTGIAPSTFAPYPIPPNSPQSPGDELTVADDLTTTETTHNGITGTWTFNGWGTNDVMVTDGEFIMPDSDVVFAGTWTFTPDPGQAIFEVHYTVTGIRPPNHSAIPASAQFLAGATVTVASNLTTTSNTHNGVRGTWTFNGWAPIPVNVTIIGGTFTMPSANVMFVGTWTFTAAGGNDNRDPIIRDPIRPPPVIILPPLPPLPDDDGPQLARDDHFRFIFGFEDGTMRPDNPITREEVATIFFRLLEDDSRNRFRAFSNTFADVDAYRWSNQQISTKQNAGTIQGRPDGTFDPAANITRAEFAAIAMRFENLDPNAAHDFHDVSGHWGERYIASAAQRGWIVGYPDGTFRPDQSITRVEAMTLINRVLDRYLDHYGILEEMIVDWPDLPRGHWGFYNVQEATVSNAFERRYPETYSMLKRWLGPGEDVDFGEQLWLPN
ncbi:MAG: S-layer homology domain-containing protein [Oscillospiraceae bacterium]|nr:S-layer homology domain-containing protein [Oscillospiraceae bacterium]